MPSKSNLPEIFYDPSKGHYYLFLKEFSRYLKSSASDIKDTFKKQRMEDVDEHNKYALSLGDEILCDTRNKKFVDYAGPLAGHNAGFFETSSGMRVLVTHGITPPGPSQKCPCKNLWAFLEALFGDQLPHVALWLKCRYESLVKGDFRPGQLCIVVGDSGCGKGFFHVLVTELLGGRVAWPFRYMMGQTQFNLDLAQAEHLMMEDPGSSPSLPERRKFSNAVKQFVANTEMPIHGKGQTQIMLPTANTMTMSVNREKENLMVLPVMDKSMLDKVNIYDLENAQATLSDDRKKNMEMLRRELPGFVAKLLAMRIPRDLQHPRYGVLAWQNPVIFAALAEISEHEQLLAIIDQALFESADEFEVWTGSAEALKQELSRRGHAHKIEKILFHSSMVGTYLARLKEKSPERFKSSIVKGKTRWTITPPNEGEESEK